MTAPFATSPFLAGAAVHGTGPRGWHLPTPPQDPPPVMAAEAFDPALVANGVLISSGFMYTARVTVARARLISRLWTMVSVAGSVLTSGQNFMVIYDSGGTRRGVTASLHTGAGSFATAAVISPALTASFTAAAGDYYIGVLANGTTPPTLLSASILGLSSASVGNAGRARRFGFYGSGLTATPATIDPSLIDGNLTATFWMGAD